MKKTKAAIIAHASAFCIVSASSAHAQTAENPSAAAEYGNEILVTAQKRVQSASDIGVSIQAIGQDDLRRLQANDVGNIASLVTNVVATTSANLPAFTIRGVGLNEFASNFDAPVAVHIDEVYRSKPYMNSMPFFDVQRVEVLKGPQGTLFGRNTPGGSVNFYTAEPAFSNEGGFNISGDNHGRFRGDGFVNAALSENVAARFSYFVAQGTGGPYFNLTTGKHYGAPNQLAARAQIKYKGDSTTIRLTGYTYRDKSETTPYEVPGIFTAAGAICSQVLNNTIDDDRSACLKYPTVTGSPVNGLTESPSIRQFRSRKLWLANNTAYGGNFRIEQDLGSATLVAITAYDDFTRGQTEDGDTVGLIGWATSDFYSNIRQFTQEVRLSGKAGKLNYLIGGFYEHDKLTEVNSAELQNVVVNLPDAFPRVGADFVQKVRSFAFFTHNELEIVPTVSLVAGVRYTNDRTTAAGSTYLGASDPVGRAQRITPVVPVDAVNAARTDENISFRGGINWRFQPDHMLYASISRGFRSGGYNIPFGGGINEFAPERLTAYEAGYKARLLDRKLDIALAAYWYDYKNLQVNVNAEGVEIATVTTNIGSSRTYGGEAEMTYRPDPSWVLRTGISYLDAQFTNTSRTVTTYNGTVSLDGNQPVNTPHWTIQGFIQKTVPISNSLNLIMQTDGRFVDKRFLRPANQVFDSAPSYWVQNARVAIADIDGKFEIAAWGKNIFNKDYMTYLNNVGFLRIEIYGDPASYGLSASFKF